MFEQNIITGEVTSSILQFNPELSWLFDKSQSFKGAIKSYSNTLITLEDLFNGLDINDRSLVPQCAFANVGWQCVNGHSGPDVLDSNGDPCGGNWYIDINTAPVNGGSSTIIQPIKNRPDWEDVEEVLKGDRPISDLGCN
ncbi:hypothetical protein SCB49_06377 [unidentified eubacterium SCB49]|nr:hypothetical protein SCB49_06377 [unidentified eubacterium SCB49]